MANLLRSNLRSIASRQLRCYSTAPAPSSNSNLAPILLGLGLAGAGGFYYSTLNSPSNKKPASSSGDKIGLTGKTALNPDEFTSFKLEKIEKYNHNTSTFTFALPEGTTSGMTVASAVVVKSAKEGEALDKKGKPAIKPYTPVSAPDVQDKLRFLIKHYPGGVMTSHIFSLAPGDSLQIKGPIPKFTYKANQFDSIALIAGGSGITPMWQLIQQIDSDPSDKTKVHLVFGNVTEEDILLRKELEAIAKSKPSQFKFHFVLDQPPSGWTGPSGYMDQKLLGSTLPAPTLGEKVMVFVCGPPGQVKAISGPKASFKDQGPLTGVLAELGYTESQVYKF
ncbi:ferredoxin reductase-like protein [Meredithblackwellia eburnea MCA 4105]